MPPIIHTADFIKGFEGLHFNRASQQEVPSVIFPEAAYPLCISSIIDGHLLILQDMSHSTRLYTFTLF